MWPSTLRCRPCEEIYWLFLSCMLQDCSWDILPELVLSFKSSESFMWMPFLLTIILYSSVKMSVLHISQLQFQRLFFSKYMNLPEASKASWIDWEHSLQICTSCIMMWSEWIEATGSLLFYRIRNSLFPEDYKILKEFYFLLVNVSKGIWILSWLAGF